MIFPVQVARSYDRAKTAFALPARNGKKGSMSHCGLLNSVVFSNPSVSERTSVGMRQFDAGVLAAGVGRLFICVVLL
jgi:hypothetical protein